MDAARLRAAFPVLRETAYLNAGSCGPLAEAAARAGEAAAKLALEEGRAMPYFEGMLEVRGRLRAAYAGVLGARVEDVALTTSTSEGLVTVLLGLGLQPGDEVLTAPDEHPGLLGPLAAARDRLGIELRTAPFAQLAEAVTPATKLVACSHVSWITGARAPAALGELDVPVLLDGAQGVGAVPVDVDALGCAFYSGAGQKWLCGPVGLGMLWVAPAWRERLAATGPTYVALADPAAGIDARVREDAGRFDTPTHALELLAAGLAAHDVLAEAGWEAVHERSASLAQELVARLEASGRRVAPRSDTTLIAWEVEGDTVAHAAALAQQGIVVRSLPGFPYLRASVGAWNDEDDLERLLAALDGLSA
ncbi:aminotransferase class V-fold PLP-dependent enzyme [Conexibacter sp. SYSU D00693]|uniref:aminotransferase class V-fold PLP-dependent enzyme n=1 Tax=Conexibacter sp. SYSU D00693 TaxID=2812560 RepID=UPI00196AAD09|nr:aminotransferase class V-fold PLP-dependent enzyme [Conexibacter sp. SYSU D00693]